MGEVRRDALRVGCTSWTFGCGRAIKLEFHGAKVGSDAGLFPCRDLDEAASGTKLERAATTSAPSGRISGTIGGSIGMC